MFELYRNIANNYRCGNYEQVISLIDEYLKIPDVGLDVEIINFYVSSLLKLGSINEESQIIKEYNDLYDKGVSNIETIIKLIDMSSYDEAKIICEETIKKYPYLDAPYYYLGIIGIRTGEYQSSINYFNKLLKYSKNPHFLEKTKIMLEGINKYYEKGKLLKLEYDWFVKKGFTLQPGYIVKLKDECCDDYYVRNRPLLIYKIVNNTIYAFPIRFRVRPRYYVIKNVYENEIQIAPNLISFEKNAIATIERNVTDEQLNFALIDLYYRYLRIYQDSNLEKDVFVNDMQKRIEYKTMKSE